MQFTILVCALLSFTSTAIAAPPACVINAIGVQGSDATDMTLLCDTNEEYVIGNITESCPSDDMMAAFNHYSTMCLETAGITVSALPDDGDEDGNSSDSTNAEANQDDNEDNGATAVGSTPNLILAASGLFVTGMTSLLFL